ncbi:protein-export chaperone SecB [Heliorestis acidaminivorans]|nr:protein-export chaperone SecB [Heliorestis acidaminivorans]
MDNKEKYSQLISMIELKNIELISLNCNQNPAFNHKGSKPIDAAIKYNTKEVIQSGIELIFPFCLSLATFSNENNSGEKDYDLIDSKDKLFDISLELYLNYYIEVTDNSTLDLSNFLEEINEFANKNVIINAWPYAREIVSNVTTRMGFPPLLLPPYKAMPKY